MSPQQVALPDDYPSIFIAPSDGPGVSMVTYELAGPGISGAVTVNTGPLIHPARLEVSSGRYLDHIPASLGPYDLLRVDGFHILTAHELDRDDPLSGPAVPFAGLDDAYRPIVLPPAARRQAAMVLDSVIGFWLEHRKTQQSTQPGHGRAQGPALPRHDARRPTGFRNHKPGRQRP